MKRTRPSLSAPVRSMALAAAFALSLFALACDSGTQEPAAPAPAAPEATEGAAPAADAAAPAPVAHEGEIDSSRFPTELPEGATAAIPDNFPSDVPVYPGSQPAQGKGIEIEGAPQGLVQLLTNDATPDVHKFYSSELQSKGWTIGQDAGMEGGTASIEASKDKCKARIMITPAEGGGSDILIATEC